MKIRIDISFRKFDGYEERGDSGYYDPLNSRKRASIDIDIKDTPFEQILTLYHEITHAVFDFLLHYKLDNKKRRVKKRTLKEVKALKEKWKTIYVPITYNGKKRKMEKEEQICQKLEYAIKRVFLKKIPSYFFDKFFK